MLHFSTCQNDEQIIECFVTSEHFYRLGTRCCWDVDSTSMTLIQRRDNIVCTVGKEDTARQRPNSPSLITLSYSRLETGRWPTHTHNKHEILNHCWNNDEPAL